MIYEESKRPFWLLLFLLLLLTLTAFSPWLLGQRDLFRQEGFYAALVSGLHGVPPLGTVHGELTWNSFPLYPLLVRLLTDLGIPMEWGLRLVPFGCLLMLAFLVLLTCLRTVGQQGALAAAAVFLTSILMGDKFSEGCPVLLGTLGIFSCWILWFDLGIWRGTWWPAWILSGWVAGLTFYAIGWEGLLLIAFPMLLLRRPLSLRSKPHGVPFYTGIALILFFILLWGFPRWQNADGLFFRAGTFRIPSFGKYLLHLVTFPFMAAFRFLPWTLFAWAPFCPALEGLDKNPMMSKYMRTLFLGLFFLMWLSPFTESRDMLYLIPPLAVLIGLNYRIVVRRYSERLFLFCEWASVFSFLLSLAAFLFTAAPPELIKKVLPVSRDISYLNGMSPEMLIGILSSAGGCAAAGGVWFMAKYKVRVWLIFCTLFLSVMLPFQAVVIPYRSADHSHKELGLEIRRVLAAEPILPKHPVLYRFDDQPHLYSELHYAGVQVRIVQSARDLPRTEKVIYVLSSAVPSSPERIWKQLKLTNKNRLELWKGELKQDEGDDTDETDF